jgi:uncharacterized protein YqhQ
MYSSQRSGEDPSSDSFQASKEKKLKKQVKSSLIVILISFSTAIDLMRFTCMKEENLLYQIYLFK